MLTKTKILRGVQCQKFLWLQENPPPNERVQMPSLGEQHIMKQGQEVERMARKQFPGGKLVVGGYSAALESTRDLMDGGAECLFQATFFNGVALVRCDILCKNGDAWDIVEVKSSTKEKAEHIDDLAIQWYIVENSGVSLSRAFLMLVNNSECVFPDLSNLMKKENITDRVKESAAYIPNLLIECGNTLTLPKEPNIGIGEHCYSPRECSFVKRCWKNVPKNSFNTIPRLGWEKKRILIERDVLDAGDAVAHVKLTAKQQRYVDSVKSNKPDINKDGIRIQLAELKFPLYFLDFETINPAIPRFNEMRPFQQFPFQFSCHILQSENCKLQHCEYLHLDKSDPRPYVLSALLKCIGEEGGIVAYHKQMESGVLKGLCEIADEDEAERLRKMQEQLWDLEDIFKQNYLHPEFLGSNSMKAILPVIVPKLSYDNLEINDGNDAPAAWNLTIRGEKDYANALREYCKRDTEGMVEIYRCLRKI